MAKQQFVPWSNKYNIDNDSDDLFFILNTYDVGSQKAHYLHFQQNLRDIGDLASFRKKKVWESVAYQMSKSVTHDVFILNAVTQ